MNTNLEPKDHAEAVALFRAQVLGPLLCVDLRRRELASRLRELSERRYMPPGAKVRRKCAASTLEWDRRPLLSLVLVGLPELWGRMALRKNRSLWSRVHCRITIPAAEVGDTTEYVDHRLRRVGAKKMLLASDALTLLHEATAGQLRDIDRIATKALRLCARRKLHAVDRELLEQVLEADQTREGPREHDRSPHCARAPLGAVPHRARAGRPRRARRRPRAPGRPTRAARCARTARLSLPRRACGG